MRGELKDPGLKALLKTWAGYAAGQTRNGLCLISTREAVYELNPQQAGVACNPLEQLSVETGSVLLRGKGIHSSDTQLAKAVTDFAGHALALNLPGTYLATVHQGDIRKRDLIAGLAEEPEQGSHARRVMVSYETWLQDTPENERLCPR